jgi:general secretion pathway protein G
VFFRLLESDVMNCRYRPRYGAGFTLIELLVVLLILGMIAGLAGPQVMKYLGESKTKTAKLQIEELSTSLYLFKLDAGRYPDTQEGLQALVQAPSSLGADRWHGPYLKKKAVPKDPWGNEYRYAAPGQHGDFDIVSLGSDGREGGEGEAKDVASWE